MENVIERHRPAAVYDESFVPALFAQWGPVVAEAAAIRPGQRVLDVACGTGALSGAVAERVGPAGSVVGLDLNPEMLEVARQKPARIEWRHAPAEALPFPDAAFDAVVSQFGLMFFTDRVAALREMWRVLRPGGRLAVAVFAAVEESPGYAALVDLLDRLFGRAVGDGMRAPFALGDPGQLQDLATAAGIADARVTRHTGTVDFPSIEALIATERACIWTLGGMLDGGQFDRLRKAARPALAPFVTAEGRVQFELPALILEARRQR
jgi:ubiquinone/menaquinone biosynthesis C-methylase UbiE